VLDGETLAVEGRVAGRITSEGSREVDAVQGVAAWRDRFVASRATFAESGHAWSGIYHTGVVGACMSRAGIRARVPGKMRATKCWSRRGQWHGGVGNVGRHGAKVGVRGVEER